LNDMKSSIKIPALMLSIILFVSIMTSFGCDEDKAWETVNTSAGQVILIGLVLDLTRTFTVSVTVAGLNPISTDLVLQNNGGDNLTISVDGTYTFSIPLHRKASYSVDVLTQPMGPDQTCTVSNGTGTIVNSNITNITVSCI
jgi:hypothetical protein